ncbi:MAG: ABC transporter substrate-binding protein [Oscillospiraceae bacterium]|nr:ABC transporter substrate-binding protein [Oscillospiraceae bacterium]
MKKILGMSLALAMLLTLLTGCGGGTTSASTAPSGSPTDSSAQAPSGDPIKIAVAAPMTGDNAEYGQGFQNAAQMMVDQWNSDGGVLGRPIELVSYDDKNSSDEAASIAQKIVSEGDIVGVIGHFSSGVCLTAAPVYQQNKIIEISPSASNPKYSEIGDYIFRNNTVISVEAQAALDIATKDLGKKNIGILAIKTDWGTSTEQIVQQLVTDNYPDAKVVDVEEVLENSDDYSSAITKLDKAGTDVLICVSMYSTLAPVAIQYKQVNPDIQIVGFSNAYSQQLVELGGAAVEGVCLPVIFFAGSDNADIKSYVDEYTQKYGSAPSALTSQAYDSVGMLLEAIKQAGTTDQPALRDALAKIEYKGVTGNTKFDEKNNVTKDFVKLTIKDGKFVEMK